MSTIQEFIGSAAISSAGVYAFAKHFGHLNPTNAAIAAGIYTLATTKFKYDGNNEELFGHVLTKINTKLTKDLNAYTPIFSRVVASVVINKTLGIKPAEILQIAMVCEIVTGLLKRMKDADESRLYNSAGVIGIATGISYLAAERLSIINPMLAASHTVLISLVLRLFTDRVEKLSEDIGSKSKISLVKSTLDGVKKFAIPLSALVYCANAYSRGIAPVHIAAMLGLYTIGNQVGRSSIALLRGKDVSDFPEHT